MKNCNDIFDILFRQMGIHEEARKDRVLIVYDEIVGAKISKVTRPYLFKNGILYVKVNNSESNWSYELFFWKKQIIEKYNQYLQSNLVKDIKFIGE